MNPSAVGRDSQTRCSSSCTVTRNTKATSDSGIPSSAAPASTARYRGSCRSTGEGWPAPGSSASPAALLVIGGGYRGDTPRRKGHVGVGRAILTMPPVTLHLRGRMRRQHLASMHPLLGLLGLLLGYFAFPVGWSGAPISLALGVLVTGAGLGLLGWTLVQELERYRRGESIRSAQSLSMLLVLLVMSSSLGFFLLNLADPDQVLGLQTRTDALYFTLSTMTTVGFGDVHAQGQLGRALVCVLIVFNVVVVAALLRALARPPAPRAD